MFFLARAAVLVVTFVGLLLALLLPCVIFVFVVFAIWEPQLMYKPIGLTPVSTILFFCFVPAAMLLSAVVYVALVILPVFAKYEIPLRDPRAPDNVFSILARWMHRMAVRYAHLMETYRR